MTLASAALGNMPAGLRGPLIREYESLVRNFLERRWSPATMSGGLFCEIVYTIVAGHLDGNYPAKPSKPKNMVQACRALEAKNGPRSFQILIPRLLPVLYEIRNNRGVGHVGGDVNPNHMDAAAVVAIANWVMAELVRVLHDIPNTNEAQAIVDQLVVRRSPLVWDNGSARRVLDPKIKLPQRVLILLNDQPGLTLTQNLFGWAQTKDFPHFKKTLKRLHAAGKIQLTNDEGAAEILPPGSIEVEELIRKRVVQYAS